MRMSTLIRTTNRQVVKHKQKLHDFPHDCCKFFSYTIFQVDVRLNEIELQLGADSESEELSLEEEERNQESFI